MPGPTITEQRQKIVSKYRKSGQPWPATARQIAFWAYKERLWQPRTDTVVGQLADELARAMREEVYTDKQGREVRTKHAARTVQEGKQTTLWDDIRTAKSAHMKVAFQQRQQQIVGDCRQLKTDVDSYNDNRTPGTPLQLIWDFTEDVAEIEALEVPQRKITLPAFTVQQHSERSRNPVLV